MDVKDVYWYINGEAINGKGYLIESYSESERFVFINSTGAFKNPTL